MKKTKTLFSGNASPKTNRFLRHGFFLALTFILSIQLNAQVTIFTESMGSVGGTTTISAHEAANGFDNDPYLMTGSADVRNTTPSSGYTGASGLANIFITNTTGTFFQIEGINTVGMAPMDLSFGINKNLNASNASDLIVEVSTNGISYTPLSFPVLPTGAGTSGTTWFLRTTTSSIPATANLRIRFRNTNVTGTQYRIDDVKLVSTACTTPTISPAGPVTLCQGNSVTLTSSAGVSYLWSTGATTQSISVSTTGSYSVTVTAANGCVTTSAPTSVTVNPNPSNVVNASGPTTFCAEGSVVLSSAESGASYTWSNGSHASSITVTASGTFTLTVTKNGCTSVSAPITVTENPSPTPTVVPSTDQVICQGSSVTLSTGSYASYLWSNGATTQSISATTSGAYSVSVVDANGCSGSSADAVDVYVRSLPNIVASADAEICKGSSATLNAAAYATDLFISEYVEGSGNNKYIEIYNGTAGTVNLSNYRLRNYSNGSSSPVFDNLLSGTLASGQTVVYKNAAAVTYGGVATAQTSVVFNGNDAITLFKISTSTTIDIIGRIGDDPGTEWTSGLHSTLNTTLRRKVSIYSGVGFNPTGTGPGAFTTLTTDWDVYATDDVSGLGSHSMSPAFNWAPATGLSSTTGASVTASPSTTTTYTVTGTLACSNTDNVTVVVNPNPVASASATTILCHGGTATVTVSASGGTAPYSGTGTFTVGAGTYTYTISDAKGCSGSTSITVTEPTALSASSSATAILCNGGESTVTVSATGGTAPYSGTGTFYVTAGTYTYTVTDANGCSTTTTVSISQPTALSASASATQILCNGDYTTITVSATGGTAPYSGTGTFTELAGTYNYTITDANGCFTVTNITVFQPDALLASSSATAILCHGGTATVSVSASGGTAPYSGTGTFTVGAGTYSYTVTDANGCTATTSITVTEPTALSASSSATAILCHGGTATVTVSATGGTGSYSGTGTFTVGAGTYSYTVTDANGCTATTSITVTEPTALSASSSATKVLCNGGTATVTVTASGGTAPYSGTGTFTVGAGTYSYTVTDANGCTASTSVTVGQPSSLSASIGAIPLSSINSCAFGTGANIVLGYGGGATTANLNGSASGGTPGYTYSWSPATGLSSSTSANPVFTPVLASGCNVYNFTLTVTDASGCTATATTSVKVVNVLAPIGSNPKEARKVLICHRTNGINPSITIEVSASAVPAHLAHGDCLGSCENTCEGSSGKSFIAAEDHDHDAHDLTTELAVYPNPSNGKFTLELNQVDESAAVEVIILDMTGKQVYAQHFNESGMMFKTEIQLEHGANLSNSLYVLKVINGDQQFIRKINITK